MNALLTLLPLVLFASVFVQQVQPKQKSILKNGMSVSWHHANDRIYFEVSSPTTGWVTIGFNEKNELTNAYLLMGRMHHSRPQVVEHYVASPGNYFPIESSDIDGHLADVEGSEFSNKSKIRFSVLTEGNSDFRKVLTKGKNLYMILAYSQSDDFQHHSMMRTMLSVQL